MVSSLEHRKDIRSTEIFKDNIKDFTNREKIWAYVFKEHLEEQGFTIELHDHGVDNEGELIEESLKNHNLDFLMLISGRHSSWEMAFDVKTAPLYLGDRFFTFKKCGLKSCLEEQGFLLVPREEHYYVFYRQAIEHMLATYPARIYPKFSANDLAIRIFHDTINFYVEKSWARKENWMPTARVMVSENNNILWAEKSID